MTKFLLDVNLAPGLAARVRAAGYDCVHVTEFLSANASDPQVAMTANRLGAVLVTKDADFVDFKTRGVLVGALVWLRSGNMSNQRMTALLLPEMPRIIAAIGNGETIIEIR